MSLKSCDLKKLPNYNSTKQAFSIVISFSYIGRLDFNFNPLP